MALVSRLVTTVALTLCLNGIAHAAHDHHVHHDYHQHPSQAPASVMGEHVHPNGEWMVSYTYMLMNMDGMRDGTDDLSDQDILQDFMVTPLHMTMEMHMVGAMYAATDCFPSKSLGPNQR